MILFSCAKCNNMFTIMKIRNYQDGRQIDLTTGESIKCECGNLEVKRVDVESDGFPSIGKYSATNETNRKK